uniref:FUN14 domain-containing protein 1 n=1 Tax=Arion vulgaris TaxID=1028688 RepID=A0A0B6YT13_9EUPU
MPIYRNAEPKSSMDFFTERIFGDITKSSACKQLGIGAATGWVTGYMANKIGKIAAISAAGGFCLFQIAQYNGYITVNWTRVQHALTKAQAKAKKAMIKHSEGICQKSRICYEENFFLVTGFATGFLIGFVW